MKIVVLQRWVRGCCLGEESVVRRDREGDTPIVHVSTSIFGYEVRLEPKTDLHSPSHTLQPQYLVTPIFPDQLLLRVVFSVDGDLSGSRKMPRLVQETLQLSATRVRDGE